MPGVTVNCAQLAILNTFHQEALIDELERRALRSETEVGRLNGMLVEQSKTIEENKVVIGGRESDGARRLNMEEMVSSYQVRVQSS